jgi:hypothetical protein
VEDRVRWMIWRQVEEWVLYADTVQALCIGYLLTGEPLPGRLPALLGRRHHCGPLSGQGGCIIPLMGLGGQLEAGQYIRVASQDLELCL